MDDDRGKVAQEHPANYDPFEATTKTFKDQEKTWHGYWAATPLPKPQLPTGPDYTGPQVGPAKRPLEAASRPFDAPPYPLSSPGHDARLDTRPAWPDRKDGSVAIPEAIQPNLQSRLLELGHLVLALHETMNKITGQEVKVENATVGPNGCVETLELIMGDVEALSKRLDLLHQQVGRI